VGNNGKGLATVNFVEIFHKFGCKGAMLFPK